MVTNGRMPKRLKTVALDFLGQNGRGERIDGCGADGVGVLGVDDRAEQQAGELVNLVEGFVEGGRGDQLAGEWNQRRVGV